MILYVTEGTEVVIVKATVCIVTGAGTGIGEAASRMLADRGASVVLVGRTASRLERVRQAIEARGGAADARPCDVGDVDAVRGLADGVLRDYGRVDVLVNNAGASSHNRTTLRTTPDEAEAMMRVNLMGPFFLTQAVLPGMLARKQGTIVNVSSVAGTNPSRIGGAFYGAVKAGLLNFTRYLNVELENSGVRACCILPGEVDTPAMENRPVVPDAEARSTMLAAEDVAEAILLATASPHRSLVEEITVRPTYRRDMSREMMDPFEAAD